MLRKTAARQPTAGFTLLEMILALLIGVILMWTLYSVLSQQVQQAQGGRLILHEGTLARSILTRMTNDILGTLGAVNPLPPSSGAGGGGANGASGTGGSATPSSGSMSTTDATIIFNNGIYCQNNVLILTVSKVPRELNLTGVLGNGNNDPTQQATLCDLRRISYWYVGGDKPGLARQELLQATSNDLNIFPTDVSDPSSYVIAPEVKDISFQFFDGVNWQDSWDGTTPAGLNDLPMGPPSAVKITLTFNRRASDNTELPDDQLPKYSHVVAIPAGNNFPQTNP
jgi:prepilin-type N-terminal cleavage/methylation domain-containing protein